MTKATQTRRDGTMKKQIHLEGGLDVEMKNGDRRTLTFSPFDDTVRHIQSGVAFGLVELTDEAEFRSQIGRVVSRSTFDKR